MYARVAWLLKGPASTRDFSAPALAYQKAGQPLPSTFKNPSRLLHDSPVFGQPSRPEPGQQPEGQIESADNQLSREPSRIPLGECKFGHDP